MTQQEFIKQSNKIHNNKYSYDNVVYTKPMEKVSITCPKHGDFLQSPYEHLRGHGCPHCAGKGITTEKIIERFRQVHSDKYDYSLVKYVNTNTKVDIICPKHGVFHQTPKNHLHNHGCPYCAGKGKTTTMLIEQLKQRHNDKYDYSKVVYKGARTYIKIICPKHGEFLQTPNDHLNGKGCPKCGFQMSIAEDILCKFIQSLGFDVLQHNRTLLQGQEIDILIPDKKLGIEYNGILWHSEEYGRDKNYHLNKTLECEKRGINLIHIFEDEWLQHPDIVLSKIAHLLGKNKGEKIMARKCHIQEINKQQAKDFYDNNHIQGYAKATLHIGAFYNDQLISAMSFTKTSNKTNDFILIRFATDIHLRPIGIAGKLFKYFIRNYTFSSITTFADRRWTLNPNDNLYTTLGFKLTKILKPDYHYVDKENLTRIHKFNFRKQKLHKKFGLPLTLTEYEMAIELDYPRIWDCGLFKFVFKVS